LKKPRFVAAVASVLLAVGIGIATTTPASASSTAPTASGLKLSAQSVAGPALTGDGVGGLSVRPNSNPYGLELRNAWNACIGFQNGDVGDGTQARQEPCDGQPDQAFRESIVVGPDGNEHAMWVNSKAGNRCLDIAYGADVDGAYVMLWDCDPSHLSQLWNWNGAKIGSGWNLTSYWIGKCLGIDGGSNGAGLPAIIWDCNSNNDQLWHLT